MKIEKKHLDDIKRCYCASSIYMDACQYILLASEDPDTGCYMYSGDAYEKKEMVWKHPGGCMSIVPIPKREHEFLAVQEFYLKKSVSLAKIVWGRYNKTSGWVCKDVLSLPFIHRFDLYQVGDVTYFIGATIANAKQDKEDWSQPGRIYVGILPKDPSKGIELSVLCDGLYRNHGYWHAVENGHDVGYFGSDQGIMRVVPPQHPNQAWTCEKILDGTIGEIATIDIDNDGEDEIMTIEPFHGDTIKIYKRIDGAYQEVYRYQNTIAFAHTLVATKLAGVATFLAGVRRDEAELFYVQYVDGRYVTKIIEKGVGPANICVVHEEHRDVIVAANHTKNEAAVYFVTNEEGGENDA